jgi:hypothetical protein
VAKLSNTQIDRLGERLKSGPTTDADLVILDDFRRSFAPAYEVVIERIRELKLEPTGRLPKSTPSIIEKLKRETIRLTQIQDIAGCRIVLPDISAQNRIVESLQATFPGTAVIDRRSKPQYGYRAVHLVARVAGIPVEIQVRTLLQHKWAELSEKLADVLDSSIKYGGGPTLVRTLLVGQSHLFAEIEDAEYNLLRVREGAAGIGQREDDLHEPGKVGKAALERRLVELETRIIQLKKQNLEACEDLIMWLITKKSS